MTTKCSACSTAPVGITGHEDLYALSLMPLRFQCRACATIWERTASGSDHKWTEVTLEQARGTRLPSAG